MIAATTTITTRNRILFTALLCFSVTETSANIFNIGCATLCQDHEGDRVDVSGEEFRDLVTEYLEQEDGNGGGGNSTNTTIPGGNSTTTDDDDNNDNENDMKLLYGTISCWDVRAVTDMSNAFAYQEDFNTEISCWDVRSVTDMSEMFLGAASFNQDLNKWSDKVPRENIKTTDMFVESGCDVVTDPDTIGRPWCQYNKNEFSPDFRCFFFGDCDDDDDKDEPESAAPTDAPVVVVVPGTGPGSDTIPAGCPPNKVQDGSSCANTVPDDQSTIGCGYIEQSGTPPNDVTETKILCVCDTAIDESLTWACDTLETTTPAPASPSAAPPSSTDTFCPSQENPPDDGSSCEGILPVAITEGTCTFLQQTTNSALESKKCTCVLENPVWSCVGDSLSPVQSPVSLMPAGQTLPTSSMPVPATPGPPTETTTQCPPSFPGDGTSCAGILQGGLAQASCTFSQTVTTNGVTVSESATCGCAVASDELWTCEGTISTAPSNAVPVDEPKRKGK